MKKILLTVLFLFIYLNIFSQVKIEKSNDIIVILGRNYYVHVVKKGETLYSLQKVYNVPKREIILVNKEEVTDLQVGSVLRIPVIDDNYKPAPIKKTEFKEHVVQRNESLYSIAHQYGTSQDQIIKYNPQIKNGLKKGSVLKIPVVTEQLVDAEDNFFKYHKIKKGDKLKLIAIEYGVTVDEIKQFNERLDFKEGQIIAIPKKHFSKEQIFLLKNNKDFNPNFIDVDLNYFEDPNYPPCSEFSFNKNMKFNVAILLPLYIDRNYNLSFGAISSPKTAHFFSNTIVFYNYLQGTLLAIDKLKKEGMNLKINIYDTRSDSASIQQILNKPELKNMDLIFGPVYSKYYGIIERFSKENRINVVSPLSRKRSTINTNPFVFQVEPSLITITKFTAGFIAKYIDTSRVIFVYKQNTNKDAISDTLLKELKSVSNNFDSLDYKNVVFSKFITPYQQNFSKTKTNIVYITSTNEVEISSIMNNLSALVNVYKYKIIVYVQPVIQNFTKLHTTWLSTLNVHYATSSIKNFEDFAIKEFDQKYRTTFGRLPDKFAYLGYDATYYFIDALRQYGKYFQFCLGNNDEFMDSGLFVKFNFQRVALRGGFENKRLNMIYYTKDLKLMPEEDGLVKIKSFFK
ncbi:MAG: LysM peptidoglycan-binding domain-containing protein [Bacteroidota bacterium]|nr:LysM peptidoglycan-binding domain-containing protein [Bacteroidota bacterium]